MYLDPEPVLDDSAGVLSKDSSQDYFDLQQKQAKYKIQLAWPIQKRRTLS